MPATKKKPAKSKPTANGVLSPTDPTVATDFLTLAEAAAYLKVAESEVAKLAQSRELPARLVGTEWRFLKSAIQAWLRTPPPQFGKEAQLATFGSWKNDPYVEEELNEIFKRRGRPENEDGE